MSLILNGLVSGRLVVLGYGPQLTTPLIQANKLTVKKAGSRTVDNTTLTRTVKKAGSRTVENK